MPGCMPAPVYTGCKCEIREVARVLDLMAKIMCRMEEHMADFSALNDTVSGLNASYEVLAAKYNELKAGGPDQQAEVDAVKAALDDLKARIDALVA